MILQLLSIHYTSSENRDYHFPKQLLLSCLFKLYRGSVHHSLNDLIPVAKPLLHDLSG